MESENKESFSINLEDLKRTYGRKREEYSNLQKLSGEIDLNVNPAGLDDAPFLVDDLANLLVDIQKLDSSFKEDDVWINKEADSLRNPNK